MDDGLSKAVEAVKTKAKLAELLGLTPQAISYWDRVPLERLLDVERVTGVSRAVLRPDIFGPVRESA
jgi:DNA-binding transcriptional regulator YdaS (Cro superfamily)